jgi:hypothetical protein
MSVLSLKAEVKSGYWHLDGPINGDAFQAYVDQVLVPELKPGTRRVAITLVKRGTPLVPDGFEGDGKNDPALKTPGGRGIARPH